MVTINNKSQSIKVLYFSISRDLRINFSLVCQIIIYTFTQQNKQTIKQKTNKTKRKQKPKTKNYLAQNQVKTMHLNSNSSISEMVWEIKRKKKCLKL